MRVLVFQHESDGGPGYLGEALQRRGADLHVVRLDAGESLPDPAGYDMLLIMGGVMNVYQEDEHPWLTEENLAILRAVEVRTPILGICLGGQLLAKALGAQVRVGAAPEVGVTPIALDEAGRDDPLFAGLPAVEAVNWHYDTFDIPSGAVRLAGSDRCLNQAFRYGSRAYGLQFHPEVTPAMLADWLKAADGDPKVDAPVFQREFDNRVEALRAQADRLIDNFLNTLKEA